MNPNTGSLFVPAERRADFGPAWHGCAVRLARASARLRYRIRTGWESSWWSVGHLFGLLLMARKAARGISFFTERSLAEYLAVSDRTIRNWIRRGELPSYKLGAARRIDPADVEEFLIRHRDEAA